LPLRACWAPLVLAGRKTNLGVSGKDNRVCTIFIVFVAIVILLDAVLFVTLHFWLRPFADTPVTIGLSVVVEEERCDLKPDFSTLYSVSGICGDHTGGWMLYLVKRFWRILMPAKRVLFPFACIVRWLDRDLRACCHYAAFVVGDGAFRELMRRRFDSLEVLLN
jgi:hypothetical protein